MYTLTCIYCGKEFTEKTKFRKNRFTCSRSCWGKWKFTGKQKTKQQKLNMRRANAWKYTDEILEKYNSGWAILWLAKEYKSDKRTIRQVLKEQGIKTFRGRKEIRAWNKDLNHFIDERIMKWSGKNSPYWKGGITSLIIKIRSNARSRKWAIAILEKGNYTCKLCEKKGGDLEADHYPKMFCEIMEEYKIKSLEEALNCKELWSLENGRILCKKCHKKETVKQMKLIRSRRTK